MLTLTQSVTGASGCPFMGPQIIDLLVTPGDHQSLSIQPLISRPLEHYISGLLNYVAFPHLADPTTPAMHSSLSPVSRRPWCGCSL